MKAFPLKLKFGLELSFFIIFLIIFSFKIFASQIFLSSPSANLSNDYIYPVNLILNSKVSDGTNYYLRGAFQLSGSSNYCGATLNGTNDWYEGPYTTNNGWQNLFNVTVKNSSWSGQLFAKFDFNDNACNQNGNYIFKIIRYTSNGAAYSDETQNPQTLNIVIPTPTSTPTPTPLPTLTDTPIPTPSPSLTQPPTNSPTTILNTDTPTVFLPTDNLNENSNNSIFALNSQDASETANSDLSQEILGTDSAKNLKQPKNPTPVLKTNNKNYIFALLGIFIILISCGILIFKFYVKKRRSKSGDFDN